jgi:peptidoglycan/xylan/chitin deacetylase (PgdA/CDA1 family)
MPDRNLAIFIGEEATPAAIEHVETMAREFPTWQFTVFEPRAGRRADLAGARKTVALPRSLDGLNLPNVVCRPVASFDDRAFVESIEKSKPWLGVAIGAALPETRVLRAPERGTIRLRKGLGPEDCQSPPGLWELNHAEPTTGSRAEWLDGRSEAWTDLVRREVAIPPYATPGGLRVVIDILSSEVLVDALRRVDNGCLPGDPPSTPAPRPIASDGGAPNGRTPRDSAFGRLRTAVKHVIMLGYVFLWAPTRNRFLALRGKCHVTVLLYHRIDDAFRDSVSVGVEQFDRQLAAIQEHYEVLDLESFLRTRDQPRKRPCVVITFDDGYASNYLASVLLRRRGLPATFFLATGIVGTDKPFPHDMARLGFCVPSLRWEQVETMARWGFTFGVHTVEHSRLSEIPLDEAMAEVSLAKSDLERRVGPMETARCLAYTYGDRAAMPDELRQSLSSLDIRWCLSGCGGVNHPHWDRLDIRRSGANWSMSQLVFRAILEGWARSED